MDASNLPFAHDASLYGELLAPIFDRHLARDTTDACVRFIDAAAPATPARMLELGVGTGRVAIPLIAAGHDVTGVEASPKMAAALAAKPGGAQVRLIMGDFSEVGLGGPYELAFAVDYVLSQLTTPGQLLRCLRNVASCLRRGALFVCESFLPPRRDIRLTTVRIERRLPRNGHLEHDWSHDPRKQLLTGTTTITADDGRVFRIPTRVRYTWPEELDAVAATAGLTLTERYSDWCRTPMDPAATTYVSVFRRA